MNAIEKQALLLIGENADSPDVYSDITPIRDSVNDAIQEIAMLTGGYTGDYTIPLVANKTFYRLTLRDDYMGYVLDVWDELNQVRLEQTSIVTLNARSLKWMKDNSNPKKYFQVGLDVLGLWPKPSSSSGTVRAKMMLIPKAYDRDKSMVKLREDFRYSCANYAASEYFADTKEPQRAAKFFQDYIESLRGLMVVPKSVGKLARLQ